MKIENLLEKNFCLKNMHLGKRCFLMGTGPSLNTQNLSVLRDEVVIVANSFFRHPDAKLVNPAYWVLADPLYWTKPEQEFMPEHQCVIEKNIVTKVFFPTGAARFACNVNFGPLIDLHFFHYGNSEEIAKPIDFCAGLPPFGQNVMNVCLMLAYYLGCNPIYFMGCDRDYWNMTKEKYGSYMAKHFYEEEARHPAINMKWEEWVQAKERTDWETDQLRSYGELNGFSIYNATPGGYFENFPRINYESLFPAGEREHTYQLSHSEFRAIIHSAIQMMNERENLSALILLDESIKGNLNRHDRVTGLEYLKAICLARQNRHPEALIFARQDYQCNPANRANSQELIKQLESICKG